MVHEPKGIMPCIKLKSLFSKPLDVPLQFQFRVVRIEDRMREEVALALQVRGTFMEAPLLEAPLSFRTDRFRQRGNHIVHIVGAHGFIEGDAHVVAVVAEVDAALLRAP
jgi:hypothetical protein